MLLIVQTLRDAQKKMNVGLFFLGVFWVNYVQIDIGRQCLFFGTWKAMFELEVLRTWFCPICCCQLVIYDAS
jgi:hypothetical protein